MRVPIYLFLMLNMLTSCIHDAVDIHASSGDGPDEEYSIMVEVESCAGVGTKSSFTGADLCRVSDLNVFIYHKGSLLEDYSGYFTDLSPLMLAFPFDRDCFNIYMFGNVGEIVPPDDESDVKRLCHILDSYDDFRVKGFPVANAFMNYRKGSLAVFKLKKLVGQYNIVMRNSAMNASYKVKDVRFLNCAMDMYPFDTEAKATVFARPGEYGEPPEGDALTDADLSALNNGLPVSLYFVENVQGELLPENTDRKKKIPSMIEHLHKGVADACTYLEITADVFTQAARYTDAKYRFYLGQNETTDFSIRRNTLYDITLDFTQNMVCEEEWRIEVDEPEVKTLTLSSQEAHVVKGMGDYVLIYGPEVQVNEISAAGYDDILQWKLEDVLVNGKECQKLSLGTHKSISGMYAWGDDHRSMATGCQLVLETVEQYNGRPLKEEVLTVYVHDRIFPLMLRIESEGIGSEYQLEALTDAPVRTEFELSARLVVDGGSSGVYSTSAPLVGYTKEGYRCTKTAFLSLKDRGQSSQIYFRELNVNVCGVESELCRSGDFYMGVGGEVYWGPGTDRYPSRFTDLTSGADVSFAQTHNCSVPGCIRYGIYSGSVPVFLMAPKGRTCSTVFTTGTSNSLKYDINDYNSGDYVPFYIVNGGLVYSSPVTLLNESAKYLDDSARKSIIYKMYGPGRDVFYPNGAQWGSSSERTPGNIHTFGYTVGLIKQFFGNVHTWQIYQDYECDFFMTVNGCTAWMGASNLDTGFRLP